MSAQFLNPPRTLEGKVAIVTGGTRGIGYTLAFDLASRGAKVVFTYSSDRSKTPADELVNKIKTEAKSEAIGVQADVGEPDSAKIVVEKTVKAFSHVDILVNNAAIIISRTLDKITTEDFDKIFRVNVRGPLLLVQAVLPHLRRPGRIINISSVGARQGNRNTGVYQGTKSALEAFTRCWATELGGDGTTVNAVSPGPVESEMLDQIDPKIVNHQKVSTAVQNRVGTPQEIAEIVAFLAEPRSSWVSGQCISASGGYHKY